MMQDTPDPALDRIADAITDGRPVDWSGERAERPTIGTRLEQMRKIEAIAAAHRTLSTPERPRGSAPPPGDENSTIDDTRTVDAQSQAPATASTWGALRILDRVSQGGFGEVYRAFDPKLQREVALKLARAELARSPKAASRFLDEARRLARIRHPNVLTVYGAEEHDGRPGFWTDLIRGRTLAELCAEQGPLGAQEAAAVGITLCQALSALHGAGLIHRDVKPQNVMREQGGRIVLLDFGCAEESVASSEPNQAGTPLFMAPEILLEGAQAQVESDVYSLGVLLYWLVSGAYPVKGRVQEELYEGHRRRQRVALRDARPDLPLAFVQVVERAIAPDPAQRFASAGEMERALVSTLAPTPLPTPSPRRKKRPVRSSTLLWVSAAVAVAAVALGSFMAWSHRLRVDMQLYKQTDGGREELHHGARVQPGDRLYMEIRGSHPFYVYVVNEDAHGDRYVLFPAAPTDPQPLTPRTRHRLPPPRGGTLKSWEVTSAGGTETVLVLAARAPLTEFEGWIEPLPRAGTPGKPRGIGGLADEDQAPVGPGTWIERIVHYYGESAHGEAEPLIWRVEIENTPE